MKKLLRPDEAAERLRVCKKTVYRLISNGNLPAFRIRGSLRISAEALDNYVKNQILKFQLEKTETFEDF